MEPEEQLRLRRRLSWILIMVSVGAFFAVLYFTNQSLDKAISGSQASTKVVLEKTTIRNQEKQQIDQWITVNALNQFGDPTDTVYKTPPTVDEIDGEDITRYEYIVKHHPDKPWKSGR